MKPDVQTKFKIRHCKKSVIDLDKLVKPQDEDDENCFNINEDANNESNLSNIQETEYQTETNIFKKRSSIKKPSLEIEEEKLESKSN